MKKIAAIVCALALLMSVGIVGGGEVVITDPPKTTNPVIEVENLSAYTEANTDRFVIPTQLNISTEHQLIVPMQKSKETISIEGNISKISEHVIPIKNINLTHENETLIIEARVTFNKTEPHNISIEKGDENLVLNSNDVMVCTNLILELDTAGIYVKTGDMKKEIKILPDMALDKVKGSSIKSIELKSIEQEPVYKIKATREGRILGIFPVTMDIGIDVNANCGEIKVKKPWWSLLCSEGA